MKPTQFTKRTSKHLALMLAVVASSSASAFVVDNSQSKTVSSTNGVTTSNQRAYAVGESVTVQSTPTYTISQSEYYEPAPTYTSTPAPAPQLSQSQTVSVAPAGSQPVQAQASTNYSTQQYNNYNFSSGSSFAGDQLAISPRSAAVLVYDIQSDQVLFAKNADVQRSIASISKVMTAMVILDAQLDMREEITLIASDLVGAKQASTRLKAGDRMTRSEFTLMMLMRSENPAAKALGRTYPGGYDAFIDAMNRKAQELGMYQTAFSDTSGLDPRNRSSATDLVKMMKAVNTDPRYHSIRNFSTAPQYDFYIANYNSGNRTYKGNNTNRLVREGTYPIGVQKTGFIREAGYSVVMETNVNNRPAIIVQLGASNSENRWSDAESILTELAYRR
ncbi:D-alanyl-D-alanine carboxypeptidase family protein [Moraxella pluranimalium]|uniref:Peptidase S11 n=1 Tax=Moraxella pluranimalium TaxID=470453 RepID=A0A1T0CQX7_9GAMM|nr:serine hydrolase [Moraxella pluranimalium]OOS24629.1 peptidase S11 [Moraxella pluranimalium]